MRRKCLIIFAMFAGVLLFGMGMAFAQDTVPRMSKEELKTKLGAADVAVIDVRGAKAGKELMIAGAIREDPSLPEKWAGRYGKNKTLVLYCA